MGKDVHTLIVDFFVAILPTRLAPRVHAAQRRHRRLLALPMLH
jgi:hypothetical protein